MPSFLDVHHSLVRPNLRSRVPRPDLVTLLDVVHGDQLQPVLTLLGHRVTHTAVVGVGVGGEDGGPLAAPAPALQLHGVGADDADGAADLRGGEWEPQVALDKVPHQSLYFSVLQF